jgi:hypothetical protein
MQDPDIDKALRLASLFAPPEVSASLDSPPRAEEVSGWIQGLLLRHGCSEPVRLPNEALPGFFALKAAEAVPGPKLFHRFTLRLALSMADLTYRHLLAPAQPVDPALVERFVQLAGTGVTPINEYSQQPCDAQSSIRRAVQLDQSLGSGPGSVLFVGDDDATSVALALLRPEDLLWVIDIDQRVLRCAQDAAARLGVHLHAESADVRAGVPVQLRQRFTAVCVDPPRNYRNCKEFLQFAAGCIEPGPRARIFWSDHPDWTIGYPELLAELPELGLECLEVLPEFHSYPSPREFLNLPGSGEPTHIRLEDAVQIFAPVFGFESSWLLEVLELTCMWSHLHLLGWQQAA